MTPEQPAQDRVALIDIGNTRMKIGWLDAVTGEREHAALALAHNDVDRMLEWLTSHGVSPGKAVGVNVAGDQKAQVINAFFCDRFNIAVRWLGSERAAADVFNRYCDAAQLGADRWIAMVGLSQIKTPPDSATPLLLASFGTATTLDTLCPVSQAAPVTKGSTSHQTPHVTMMSGPDWPANTRWVYEGGLIFPGPGLMRASLANNTAQLPEANGTTTAFPTDTHKAITTGIAAAQAGALMRQWQACLQRYGVAPRVYGTGGGWPAVQDEAQALLATAQRLHNIPEQRIQYLASPILDGLARMVKSL